MTDTFNLWVWEQPSWRVLANYPTWREARAAAKRTCDPSDTLCVCAAGSIRDNILRANCTDRQANVRVASHIGLPVSA